MAEKTDKLPMYQVIMEELKQQIATGVLRPHDPLPTQIELARIYNTSEITSRRALSDLVQEGLIYRVRGKGSFVQEGAAGGVPRAMRTIYFVVREMAGQSFNHPFYAETLAGIQEVCEEHGVAFSIWDLASMGELPDDTNAGLILIPGAYMELSRLEQWRSEGRRLVTIHYYFPHLNIPYVVVDNLTGGYLATQHLLSLGHKRIGIILTGRSIMELNQEFSFRLQGYRLALSQHNIPFDPEMVCVVDGPAESHEMGYEGLQRLIDKKERPTAVFTTSDYKAFGVMKAAREMGLRIPEDLSIVGYDDVVMGQYTYPNLTTINQNTKQLGRRAAEMLIFDLQNDANRFVKEEIVPSLIVRDSTSDLEDK
ncbi:GntR family transcriptional regulator [Paenibacillus sp. GCM10027626]|uniref:GntR family transcriptional regulator n=1 Tax=Paenibacillus sp. GCM10027626 TaxID=3273411 RepID=UPI0036368847